MMNSYEFDQPLDLRLKALNLSLGTYHQGTISGSCGSSSSNYGSGSSINSSASSSSSNISSCSTPSHLTVPSVINAAIAPVASYIGHQVPNRHNHHHHQVPHHHPHHGPILTTTYCHPVEQQQHAHTNSQAHTSQHMRSGAIHCQPLNHHQPHPLSRLHPVPSHLQPNSHVQQQQQHPLHQTSTLLQSSAPQTSPPHHLQPPVSHQQLSPQLPPALKTDQSSPQHNHSQQHHHAPVSTYRPIPVKSLSISCHHHLLSTNGHYSPSSASPPNQTSSSGQAAQISMSAAGKQAAADIPHQQLMKLSASVRQSDSAMQHQQRNNLNSPAANRSSASSTHQNGAGQTANNDNNTNDNNANQAAPITRQHSLVSRYQCKPCNISFTQPETLRAHQEGYCTKRDRTQTQVRSQSAVSPTTLQQSSPVSK